jgi:hypothetical protein
VPMVEHIAQFCDLGVDARLCASNPAIAAVMIS